MIGPARERRYRVRFPEPPHAGRVVLDASGLAKSYGGPPVFEDISFTVERGGVCSSWGSTAPAKPACCASWPAQTRPSAGEFRLGVGVSTGYYAQEHEGIRPGASVLDHMKEGSAAPEVELRSLLGMFGLVGDMAFQDAGTLSGGEKTKLALAQLVAGRHNLLLLDEPTNNLDPPSRDAIGRALSSWPGSMVLVSHDTALRVRAGTRRGAAHARRRPRRVGATICSTWCHGLGATVAARPAPSGPTDDISLALELSTVADRLTVAAYGSQDLVVETKPDLTPVTDADRAVEMALRRTLAEARPGDAVVGEEYGFMEGAGGGGEVGGGGAVGSGSASGGGAADGGAAGGGARRWGRRGRARAGAGSSTRSTGPRTSCGASPCGPR